MTIKMIKTDSEFLENTASKIEVYGEEWYYSPHWYKKVGEGLFEVVPFEKLPYEVKQTIDAKKTNNHDT